MSSATLTSTSFQSLQLTPTGVTAAQVVAGAHGDDVLINAAIAAVGSMGGGSIYLSGAFVTGDWIFNLENSVHLLNSGPASITPAVDFTSAGAGTFDWGIVMGRTGGTSMTSPAIDTNGFLTLAFNENGAIGPNDQVYLVTTPGANLPAGFTANQLYYLVNYKRNSTTVTTQLSLTRGGAPISCPSIAGIGSLWLFYTWFYPSNINTSAGTITLPSAGQRLPIGSPIVFRASSNNNADLPAGLLGRPNLFYAVNETANGDGTYSYQFSRNIGGTPVTLTNSGTSTVAFSAIPCTTNQILKGISIDATALTSMPSSIGAIQMQSAAYNVAIVDCPTLLSPHGSVINCRGVGMSIINNGIVNTNGGIMTNALTSAMRVYQNAFTGSGGGPDVTLNANSPNNVIVNNKLTSAGISGSGTNSIISPNF